jgi:hypothetical protein
MLAVYALATSYHILASGGGTLVLPPTVLSIIRGCILSLNTAAIFFLSFAIGRKEVSSGVRHLFVLISVFFFMASAAQLMLASTGRAIIVGLTGYTLARRKIPCFITGLLLVLMSVLHSGKFEMREQYWTRDSRSTVAVSQYPEWYLEWFQKGISSLYNSKFKLDTNPNSKTDVRRTLADRASLMHLFLMLQWRLGNDVGYLRGETYSVLPFMVVPRIVYKDKPSVHHGNNLISSHMRMQKEDSFARHTIGWGLVNEAYANYGATGLALLAVFLGLIFGRCTRMSVTAPLTSTRFFLSGAVLSCATQLEWTMGTLAATLSQMIAVLFLYDRVSMRGFKRVPTAAWPYIRSAERHRVFSEPTFLGHVSLLRGELQSSLKSATTAVTKEVEDIVWRPPPPVFFDSKIFFHNFFQYKKYYVIFLIGFSLFFFF